MNIDELIEYKKRLMENMRYGEITSDEELPNFRTKEEIISQTETALATSYIEKGIEQMVNFLGILDYDYDLLIVTLKVNGFIKEAYFKRNYNVEPNEQEPLERRDVLDDYISFTCEIDPFKYEENLENIEPIYTPKIANFASKSISPTRKFIVNYNEFINIITQLGYSIQTINNNYKDFNSIKDYLISDKGYTEIEIRIDFTKKNKNRQH